MTVGKDVSMLFTDVINCIQTDNIELKKVNAIHRAQLTYALIKKQRVNFRDATEPRLQGMPKSPHAVNEIFDLN
jgi:hypothetical protein